MLSGLAVELVSEVNEFSEDSESVACVSDSEASCVREVPGVLLGARVEEPWVAVFWEDPAVGKCVAASELPAGELVGFTVPLVLPLVFVTVALPVTFALLFSSGTLRSLDPEALPSLPHAPATRAIKMNQLTVFPFLMAL